MKKIVIIGGGIAGLSAGIFAQKNGFQSIIIEKHHTLGGECTGWDRQGYHIDGCIHWLVGTKKGTEFHTLWETVGAFEGVDIYHPESFMVVEYGGITVPFYRELDRFQDSWLSISPKDVDSINELCRDIKVLQAFSMPAGKPLDMMGITEKLKHLLSLKDIGPVYNKYSKMSIAQFAAKFTHPALSTAIKSFMPEGDYSAISLVFPIATFTSGQSSIPLGGSRALANRMVNKYVELGGTVKTSCEIKDLEITDNRVVKAICEQEQSFEADYFVAACDAKVLFERLLKGRYPDPQFEKRYNNPTIYPLASNIYVGIGYEGTLEGTPRTLKFPVTSIDIKQNGKPIDYLQMTHYSYEPNFAPEGHTAITFAINQFEPELEFWENLALDRERYSKEKSPCWSGCYYRDA